MSVPNNLYRKVKAGRCCVHDKDTCGAPSGFVGHFICALESVPDGWLRIDGKWVQVVKSDAVRVGGGELDGIYADRYRVVGKDRS